VATDLATASGQQVAKRFGQIMAKSAEIVEIAGRTNELPRNEETGGLIRPPGMSDADWNIHCDAMLPAKSAPLYMTQHFTRVEIAQRIAGAKDLATPMIARYAVGAAPAQEAQYDVIDVTPSKEE